MGTLKQIKLKPGINREGTNLVSEGIWWESDKMRFRQQTPEKIGGWQKVSNATYLGFVRSMTPFVTLDQRVLVAMGSHLKYYVTVGGTYRDITPLRLTTAAGAITFSATPGSSIITVTHTNSGAITNDFVTFTGAVGLGGNITAAILNQNWQITLVMGSITQYTINVGVVANSSDTGNGGTATIGMYEINTGLAIAGPIRGWGTGWWGQAPWGLDGPSAFMRVWSQTTFGEDLVFGPNGGPMYYWDAGTSAYQRGVRLDSLPGANQVPVVQNLIISNETSRITMVFGTNDPFGASPTSLDPLLFRWSDVESIVNWNPTTTGSQAGSIRLTRGTTIVTALQTRQEILCWTDTTLYSIQYLGPPFVFGANIVEPNISIVSQNAAVTAASRTFWMGNGKFYVYDGRVNTLRCDVREYIFNNINDNQYAQIFAGTVEAYSEVWWWYPSLGSDSVDSYVIYNYLEDVWSIGKMARTAWIDRGTVPFPVGATYSQNLCYHEFGNDDFEGPSMVPLSAYILSAYFDIDDGDRFSFIWRMLPDVTFRGSTTPNPSCRVFLIPLKDSGSGYTVPPSQGGSDNELVTGTQIVPVEKFTNQVNIRVRGRQMAMRIESNGIGTAFQWGYPRLDMRQDGRRS